jgi:hypothetical protein
MSSGLDSLVRQNHRIIKSDVCNPARARNVVADLLVGSLRMKYASNCAIAFPDPDIAELSARRGQSILRRDNGMGTIGITEWIRNGRGGDVEHRPRGSVEQDIRHAIDHKHVGHSRKSGRGDGVTEDVMRPRHRDRQGVTSAEGRGFRAGEASSDAA